MAWKTYSGAMIDAPISEAVEKVLKSFREQNRAIKICIGTDSQVRGTTIDMVTVILFLVIGNGGFMYVNKQKLKQRMAMRERMMAEVNASIQTAYEISEVTKSYNVEVEIHADINVDPKFQSHQAYADAMGYTKGMGYIFKSKPDAFASSVCADKLLH
ncbi:MAG: ribonuclease H-like YkuK family protein [Flavobacteriales bacterium]